MSKAAETVAAIRATIPIHDHDVFKSKDGGYLLDTGETIIAVDPNGATSETRTDWSTGWEA